MSIRWAKYLPRFPAALLCPAILGLWAAFCTVHRVHPLLGHRYYGSGVPETERGIPFAFLGVWRENQPDQWSYYVGFQRAPFLMDLAIALAVAWAFAMVVDRTVFPWLRRRQE